MSTTSTTPTMTLPELGAYVFSAARRSVTGFDPDLKTLVSAAVEGDVSGLQGMFDAAFAAAQAVSKEARPAITAAWTLVSKRAYWHAGQAGYRLAWPRLDGKGDIAVPTLTPKDIAAAEASAAAAERGARADAALERAHAAQVAAQTDALRAMTEADIVSAAVTAATMCGADLASVALVLLSLAAPDSREDALTILLADSSPAVETRPARGRKAA